MSQKLLLTLAIALSSVFVGLICTLIIPNRSKAPTTPPSLPPPTTKLERYLNFSATITKSPNGVKTLSVYLKPEITFQPLSAIAIRVVLTDPKGAITPVGTTATLSKDLISAGWKFPFSKVVPTQTNGLSLDLSAVYASPQPYLLKDQQLFATITFLSPSDTLNVSLDPAVTKVMDKQNNEVGLRELSQPLTITGSPSDFIFNPP